MKYRYKLIGMIGLIILMAIACSGPVVIDKQGNFDVLWYHGDCKYSLGIIKDDIFTIKNFRDNCDIKIVMDVEEGEKFWYERELRWCQVPGDSDAVYIFHVSTANDVRSASIQ